MPPPPAEAFTPLPDTLARLARAFQVTRGLTRLCGGWLPGVPYWDAKLELGDQLWAHAQSAADLLRRLHELKESTAERQESAALDTLLREVASVRDGDDFLWGCHGVLLPRLQAQFAAWADQTDPVMDPLSRQLLQAAADRLGAHAAWYAAYRPAFSPGPLRRSPAWAAYVTALLDGIDFAGGAWRLPTPSVGRPAEWQEFACIATPRRDACFRTAWFNEVSRHVRDDFADRRRVVFYNHTQEMQFAESLGAILYETPEMPWAFHYDLARHCTDEIRHTRMGCTRLAQLGEDLRQYPMLLQNYSVRAKLEPIERFCLMTLVIEAGSFEKKRANVKEFGEQGDVISERYESYDIRDEMMHVNFGHTWVPIMLRVNRDPRSVNELIAHCRDILEDALKDERRAG
ncbi:MAG: DUF455 family protein [Opitutaceae bacterium]|nr:DUF455 family protein [Opitutaceae bacterium]